MRRLVEFLDDSRLSLKEEMDMSTLVGATITGSAGHILARVRRISPSCYFSESLDLNGLEGANANRAANNIAVYLNDYFNPQRRNPYHDTGDIPSTRA